jgi:hypothetical protein
MHGFRMIPFVGFHTHRRKTLGEPDTLFQCFLDFLVIRDRKAVDKRFL